MFRVTEDFYTFIRKYPITTVVIGICTVMTIIIAFMGGYHTTTILQLGAYDSRLVNEGQIWRLLTCAFGHMSYFHFFLNIPFILIFSRPIEQMLGSKKFFMSYLFLSVFATIMIHLFSNYPTPVAGSSGAGYGLLGMYMFLIARDKNIFSIFDTRFIIFYTLIGIIITFVIPGISITGHIGGFIGGFLLSPLVFKKQKDLKSNISY